MPDSYVVTLEPANYKREMAVAATNLTSTYGGSLEHVFHRVLPGFHVTMFRSQAEALADDPEVAYVEQDCYVELATEQSSPPWGLDRIDQRALPLDDTYRFTSDGSGAHVYVIDSGLRASHEEFTGRVGNGYSAIGDDPTDTNDCNGHGTHVAGIAAGTTYGVAKAATIHPVRVFGCSGGATAVTIVKAIDWVASNRIRPAVANMSFGARARIGFEDQAVEAAIAAGVTMVAAAGNNNTQACAGSPAGVPAAITVAASDQQDRRASFSNFGSCVDIFAPGVGVLSAGHTSDTASRVLDGTSMAAPHATGVAARYLGVHPTASPALVANRMTAFATPSRIQNPGQGTPNRLLYAGYIIAPTASFSYECSGLSCTFDGRESSDDEEIVAYEWTLGSIGDRRSGPVVNHTFSAAGSYRITLTVTDDVGLRGSTVQWVTVGADQPPNAAFTLACNGLTCTFDGRGSTDDHGISGYAWQLGDGQNDQGAMVSHTYASTGSYRVTLTVTDTAGQNDSTQRWASVSAPPLCSVQSFWITNATQGLPRIRWQTDCPDPGPVAVIVKTSTVSPLPPDCALDAATWDGNKSGNRTADYMAGGFNGCPAVEEADFWVELWDGTERIETTIRRRATYNPPPLPCEILDFAIVNRAPGVLPFISWSTSCPDPGPVSVQVKVTTGVATPAVCALDAALWDGNKNGAREPSFMAGGYGNNCPPVALAYFWVELRDDNSDQLLQRSAFETALFTP